MLNMNSAAPTQPVWKVLVFDRIGQDIIAPLLKVTSLRQCGITVHMSIATERFQIPDVPAVYFIEPTPENIMHLKSVYFILLLFDEKDFEKDLYGGYCINFCSSVSRIVLEELASYVVQHNVQAKISQVLTRLTVFMEQVFDQTLNFICLEPNLFSLNHANTFQRLNSPLTRDTDIEQLILQTSSALFAVLSTLDAVPVIKCAKGNAAEMVGKRLNDRFKDHLSNQSNTESIKGTRPTLIILDRSIDLQTMISHTWTYGAMLNDVLGMQQMKVNVSTDKGQQKFDIDINDFFWLKNSMLPFPTVAKIAKYKEEVEKLTHQNDPAALADLSSDQAASTSHLKAAMQLMPLLQEKKRLMDMHMVLSFSLVDIVSKRRLDHFFALEETIQKQTFAGVMEVIGDVGLEGDDKLRLALVWLMVNGVGGNGMSEKQYEEFEAALGQAGCDTRVLKQSVISKMNVVPVKAAVAPSNDLFGKFSSMGSKLTDHIQQAGFDAFISTVKNLLPIRHELPITKRVKAILESDEGKEVLFDPVVQRRNQASNRSAVQAVSSTTAASSGAREEVPDVIVFVVGGGSYLEYQNLIEVFGQRLAYGASEYPTPTAFMKQMCELIPK